jgi:hypothetical protein
MISRRGTVAPPLLVQSGCDQTGARMLVTTGGRGRNVLYEGASPLA